MANHDQFTHTVELATNVDPVASGTDLPVLLAQGGIAVATIVALSYLIQGLVRLVEVSKADD